ncbi:MAG TPA: hypothetical protein VL100_11885 [Croceibacterium sp.]|nr:hypothetical protein [Croceibacterium sp.]
MKAIGLAAMLLLAACSQRDAPADDVAETAQKIVGDATPTPALADGKYAPRDDCGAVEGADLFRQRLALAIEARDSEGVAALSADDVKLDFGDGSGRAELVTRLDNADGKLWGELEALLSLGCAENDQGGITLPWYFEQNIPLDPYKAMIVTGEEVPLLLGPDPKSQQLAMIDWDAVELIDGLKTEQPYQHVKFGEKEGYIETAKLRSVIDYRLSASSRNGRWRITSLVAGD